jgi:hypothetical protein
LFCTDTDISVRRKRIGKQPVEISPSIPRNVYLLPPEGEKIKFKNVRNRLRVPYVVYADFECVLQPTAPTRGRTNQYQEHHPIAVGYYVVGPLRAMREDGDVEQPQRVGQYRAHCARDSVRWFLDEMLTFEAECVGYIFNERRMKITPEQQLAWSLAQNCYICGKMFAREGGFLKVRDHDHLTGSYRGAAHQKCNLQLRKQYKIPVFFHNFRGYDGHLIARVVSEYPHLEISVIGQSMEKYLLLGLGSHLVFKDSLQFLQSSLARLVQCLRARSGLETFAHLSNIYKTK